MHNQRILLLKLKLKKLNKILDYEENENFGYSPNTKYFNDILTQTIQIKDELRTYGISVD
jgi:hypothetical protein